MKEISKYPWNLIPKDENKIFVSDQICKSVLKITYRNGQFFCTIKDRVTSKKKIIILSATFFGLLFVMPPEVSGMGLPIRHLSAPEIEISYSAPKQYHQYAQRLARILIKFL